MAFTLTPRELLDMVLLTAAAGFIFMDLFKRPADQDPVAQWRNQQQTWKRFLYASAVVAPAIILHELGHKLIAITQGFSATFHAAYTWLGLAVIVKLVNFPLLLFVPAFVEIYGNGTPLQYAGIAFAGPAVNLLLFVIAWLVLRRKLSAQATVFWSYVKYINGFLFIFNMLPIPLFDGWQVYKGIWSSF